MEIEGKSGIYKFLHLNTNQIFTFEIILHSNDINKFEFLLIIKILYKKKLCSE